MTLASFIREHIDAILAEWEAFALTLKPAAETMTALALRNHAREILLAIARDLDAEQTESEQADKSKGWGPVERGGDTAAAAHGALRQQAGFDLRQHAAEYRALRASVLKLWARHQPASRDPALADMMRFNEAVDQALAESVVSYSTAMLRSHDTFLAILGHDLRSPLNAVSMSAHYLARPGRVIPDGRAAVGRITQSVLTMSLMIRDLLEFTRTRLGKRIPIVAMAYDVGQVCEDAHDEVQSAHPDHIFDLEMEGDLRATVDPARLGQVLSNLLNNALQHGESGAPIALRARGDPAHVVIEVTNHGPVIAEEALQVIFDPLVQIPGSAAAAAPSTSLGLGLFIAREIVAGHGGTLTATSSEADGTRFTLKLPRRPVVHA